MVSVIFAMPLPPRSPVVNIFTHESVLQNLITLWRNGFVATDSINIAYAVDKARELLAELAVNGGYDYLMFWDSDIIMSSGDAVLQMIRSNAPIVCLPYFEKTLLGLSLRRFNGNFGARVPVEEVSKAVQAGSMPVDACGLGATLIDTSVFRKLSKPWFKSDEQSLAEDIYFFDKVRSELGIQPIALTNRNAMHYLDRDIVLTWNGGVATVNTANTLNQQLNAQGGGGK